LTSGYCTAQKTSAKLLDLDKHVANPVRFNEVLKSFRLCIENGTGKSNVEQFNPKSLYHAS